MRFSDSATIAALQNAPSDGLIPRQLVWFTVADFATGAPTSFGFWTEPLPELVDVVSGATGAAETRLYEGDGALLAVSKITLSANIKVRTVEVTLSKNNPRVAEAIRGFRAKGGAVEIHRILLSPVSRLPVAAARCRFLGQIDGAHFGRPAANGEGSLVVRCISDTAKLTILNPAKRNDETQRLRLLPGGAPDHHMKYADDCWRWDVPWGEDSTAPAASEQTGKKR